MVWLASTGKYWQVAPASLRAPISRRSRAPLPDPKLMTGMRPPKCLVSSGAVAAISFQVSHRPPYNSACLAEGRPLRRRAGEPEEKLLGQIASFDGLGELLCDIRFCENHFNFHIWDSNLYYCVRNP